MGSDRILRIGILTSSRADFGIYIPLLKQLQQCSDEFVFSIIAFGTHFSYYHGFTANDITGNGFNITYRINSILLSDDSGSIATSYSLTALKFASFWEEKKTEFDWVICIGDRYEMAAAVVAGIPMGIRFAHIGGGDTTLGAIDNIYRHSISLASTLHFVSLDIFTEKIREVTGDKEHCIVIGSLSLDNLDKVQLLDKPVFEDRWKIDPFRPFVLITIHPETVHADKNDQHIIEVIAALESISAISHLVITMPNADTQGGKYRIAFKKLAEILQGKITLIENFGTQSYFSSMKYADYLLGNTSSGLVEAASFGKYVVNIGDRQKGRPAGSNVLHVPFEKDAIIAASKQVSGKIYNGTNIYKKGNASKLILQALKKWS